MNDYQWYIRANVDGLVVLGYTTGFEQPQPGDIPVSGQSGRHFNIPLTNERGQPIYKIVNSNMVMRSQVELDEEWSARLVPKTPDQLRIEQLEQQLAQQSADQTAFMEFILDSMGGR
ncbi:hypothetical protein [Paenibacillus herberti]|uniref:Uncharacterized protein n=1 Tax=Paenibacillus herberti TaxID=1619309 RepID=A0A229P5I0_9BACL|nr:hypothetical protein [Paenibacillus herberti]OXM17317.1 hypothetical protein CGZ75_12140 [Paenibacillus herberti]